MSKMKLMKAMDEIDPRTGKPMCQVIQSVTGFVPTEEQKREMKKNPKLWEREITLSGMNVEVNK